MCKNCVKQKATGAGTIHLPSTPSRCKSGSSHTPPVIPDLIGNPVSPIHSGEGRNLESADEILLLFKQNVHQTITASLTTPKHYTFPPCPSPRKRESSLPYPFWQRPESISCVLKLTGVC
jgi:hypothetical protein